MRRIQADIPLATPPAWAILERSLLDLLAEAPRPFEARFCRPDGSLTWRSTLHNGGLLFAPVACFDAQERRPGLPQGVAALVRRVTGGHVALELVNLDPEPRTIIIQGGPMRNTDSAPWHISAA